MAARFCAALRVLWCALHGHRDAVVIMDESHSCSHMYRKCYCGYESAGWIWFIDRRRVS